MSLMLPRQPEDIMLLRQAGLLLDQNDSQRDFDIHSDTDLIL